MICQRGSNNANKVTHIKGRLLERAVILFNCAPFQMETSLKGKNLLPAGANYFLLDQFLMVLKFTINTFGDVH